MTANKKMPRVYVKILTETKNGNPFGTVSDIEPWEGAEEYTLKSQADALAEALKPFAKYACTIGYHKGEPPCHNCEARDALAAYEYSEE